MDLKISISFANDFKILNDHSLKEKIKNILESIKTAKNIHVLTQFKGIKGNDNAYKMGIGLYFLIGVMTSENEITLLRVLHRDQISETMTGNT